MKAFSSFTVSASMISLSSDVQLQKKQFWMAIAGLHTNFLFLKMSFRGRLQQMQKCDLYTGKYGKWFKERSGNFKGSFFFDIHNINEH